MLSKSSIRLTLRHQRRLLSASAQKIAAQQLTRQLLSLPALSKAKHIAIYWPNDGEISPLHYIQQHQCSGKIFYLPKVLGNGQLSFQQFKPAQKLRKNRYGIPEPQSSKQLSEKWLDVVLMPLVAFDQQGNRLGMGGGYYDKTFAFKKKLFWRKHPLLIGLAHDFQEVEAIRHDNWDIPLTAIVTNKQTFAQRLT